ncbi:hypothetical protein D6D21_02934 [Aureobasidium pullulans]|uniref:Uncharacterized protein n=1 Tax=Aureobasidium pullulans TaxID=5580 RepID=A0AB74J492_AURPU|nr:hypothetical protein D6D21_02934 [Aureobasidium pullulans]
MHFNPVAILVGWAVTLGAAVPLDSPVNHHADLATMAAITFNNEQALNLTAMFPAALPFRKFDKYTYRKIRECGQVVEGVDTERKSHFDGFTNRQLCLYGLHVALEHLFWKINHRCHKIWQKGTNQTLSANETAQADLAAEADHARRMRATDGPTAWYGMTLMSDDEKINTSMFPEAVVNHRCHERWSEDEQRLYGPAAVADGAVDAAEEAEIADEEAAE